MVFLFSTHVQEIDELIEEWTPEPLVEPPTEIEQSYVNKIPVISGYISHLQS